MTITIFTLFPEYFSSVLSSSIIKRAADKKKVSYQLINIRDFTSDKHKTTDDTPFGGGAGMVMKVEPIDKALQASGYAKGTQGEVIIATSAKGEVFTQKKAQLFSQLKKVAFICGHYEGIDQRVIDNLVDEEVRIGDYVLTGGEPAAVVMTDAIVRLIPGVLGNAESLQGESHSGKVAFSAPVYTKPAKYKGLSVPEVLLSGHHGDIEEWREQEQVKKE